MGLVSSQARLLMLHSFKSQNEFDAQGVTAKKIKVLQDMLSTDASDTAKMETLHTNDSLLDMDLKRLETLHKAVETEVDSVKKVIDKNIEMTFKVFA